MKLFRHISHAKRWYLYILMPHTNIAEKKSLSVIEFKQYPYTSHRMHSVLRTALQTGHGEGNGTFVI